MVYDACVHSRVLFSLHQDLGIMVGKMDAAHLDISKLGWELAVLAHMTPAPIRTKRTPAPIKITRRRKQEC